MMSEHVFYPVHPDEGEEKSPEHERQVRYLRDAFSALFPDMDVGGGEKILGWDGFETVAATPDVLVSYLEVRGSLGLGQGADPHPNRHPASCGRRFEFAVDVGGRVRDHEELLALGFGAYLWFDSGGGEVRATRLVDGEQVAVIPNAGRYTFSDEDISFEVDANKFLWVLAWDGERMPRYEQVVTKQKAPRVRGMRF